MFPGYIFIISDEVEGLYQALKQVPQLTKLLGVGEKWTPMTKEDIAIIEALSGKERVVKHSEGLLFSKNGYASPFRTYARILYNPISAIT